MSNYYLIMIIAFQSLSVSLPHAYSQSCCSGGVPISNNLGLPSAEAKAVQFALSYDLNLLNTLKEGSSKLDDRSRKRLTHSILLQSGYVINKRWSAEIFLSWIRQERIIKQFGNTNETSTRGIGDGVVLIKYRLLSDQRQRMNWFIGAGAKFPTGSSDKKDKNNISLNADLQPGSGAFDVIAWSQILKNSKQRPSMTFSGTATFTAKGKNRNYLGSQVYQFGNEWLVIAGVADQFIASGFLWGASLQTIYRHASQDKNDGENNPGTGGRWVFIRPGINLKPGISSTINISATVPAYGWVRDTQLSPTIRFNAGFYFEIPGQKQFKTSLK